MVKAPSWKPIFSSISLTMGATQLVVQEALEKIFVENKTQIFSMIHNMVGDRMIAEDLTMETFEKAFKNFFLLTTSVFP